MAQLRLRHCCNYCASLARAARQAWGSPAVWPDLVQAGRGSRYVLMALGIDPLKNEANDVAMALGLDP